VTKQDRPTALELIAATREFLETEVMPALDPRRSFHARVAANVLAIVGRELAGEEDGLVTEWRGLAALLGVSGEQPAGTAALRDSVRAMTTSPTASSWRRRRRTLARRSAPTFAPSYREAAVANRYVEPARGERRLARRAAAESLRGGLEPARVVTSSSARRRGPIARCSRVVRSTRRS
jgi:hypothetical protein